MRLVRTWPGAVVAATEFRHEDHHLQEKGVSGLSGLMIPYYPPYIVLQKTLYPKCS